MGYNKKLQDHQSDIKIITTQLLRMKIIKSDEEKLKELNEKLKTNEK
jgi:hypothetical protein